MYELLFAAAVVQPIKLSFQPAIGHVYRFRVTREQEHRRVPIGSPLLRVPMGKPYEHFEYTTVFQFQRRAGGKFAVHGRTEGAKGVDKAAASQVNNTIFSGLFRSNGRLIGALDMYNARNPNVGGSLNYFPTELAGYSFMYYDYPASRVKAGSTYVSRIDAEQYSPSSDMVLTIGGQRVAKKYRVTGVSKATVDLKGEVHTVITKNAIGSDEKINHEAIIDFELKRTDGLPLFGKVVSASSKDFPPTDSEAWRTTVWFKRL